jgi:uncharacterized protein with NRDE domain
MCLLFVAKDQLPEYPLILLFNRDESYGRMTEPLHRWEDGSGIIAGRDSLRGGTWAGISAAGKFACLTFVREPYRSREERRSRGLLVTEYLSGRLDARAYLEQTAAAPDRYFGFNIVAGCRDEALHYSNRSGVITELTPGIHGVSNADLDTPWLKVEKGKRALAEMFSAGAFSKENGFHLMQDRATCPDAALPNTGVPLDKERGLSALFVRLPTYGTRSTSLILFGGDGSIDFSEVTYDPLIGRRLLETSVTVDETSAPDT